MKINFDTIIFDMDGVLISNDSYNQAIIQTVELYEREKSKRKVNVTTNEIYELKKVTGFNCDWDVSYALTALLDRNIKAADFKREVKKITSEIKNSQKYKTLKDIFQCFYLGETVFRKVYKRSAPFVNKKGLIMTESLLIQMKLLKLLSQKYKLAIATSRPRFEALFAAKLQRISRLISDKYIVAKEDVVREKPYPDPLLKAKKLLNAKSPVYIGDTVNDLVAAKKAGMPSIFIGKEKLGDYQLENVNDLERILL